MNFEAGCDLLRIARSCKQLPFKSGSPWGPTFLYAFFVRAKNKVSFDVKVWSEIAIVKY